MMTINNATSNNRISSITTTQPTTSDAESKKLQDQITDNQQRLGKLSSDEEMSVEEKAKKRQEIQRQIAELNRKLRLQQMEKKEEVQKEAQETEKKKQLQEAMAEKTDNKKEPDKVSLNPGDTSKENEKEKQLPVVNIEGIIAADTLITHNQVQNRMDKEKHQRENVLEAEIKLDTLYGTNPQSKKEELSKSRKKDTIHIEVLTPQVDSHTLNTEFDGKIIIRE